MNRRFLEGERKWLVLLIYDFRHLIGHKNLSISSGQSIGARALITIGGEHWSKGWFLAKNPGINLRETEPSVSQAKEWKCKACTSLHLRPDAREMRNTVLNVSLSKAQLRIGSYGSDLRISKTSLRSHAGKSLGERASWRETPLTKSFKGSLYPESDKFSHFGFPGVWIHWNYLDHLQQTPSESD